MSNILIRGAPTTPLLTPPPIGVTPLLNALRRGVA